MPACTAVTHQGVPCLRLALPQGDTALVSMLGAHVLSWVAGGRERLYLSPRSRWDGQAAIRGGIPVCFPQFNQRGPLPKHGFARTSWWSASSTPETQQVAGQVTADWVLSSDATSLALWPHAFQARLSVSLSPSQLRVALSVHNTGEQNFAFSGALHTYLAVDDIATVRLQGLGGQPEWNALTNARGQADGSLRFGAEFDRVYQAAPEPLTLNDAEHRLTIAQSPSFDQTVVWNPGVDLCAQLADMPLGGHRHMLCVEAARVDVPAEVAPGEVWQGWQQLSVA